MKPVQRTQILDYVTYGERRGEIRASALAAKKPRRISIGETFILLFENRETVRYQILEMVRTEKIVKDTDIQHEVDTYNELIGGPGSLCATLLIGIDDEAERDLKLVAWVGLLERLYATGEDGARITPTWDSRQVGQGRLSAVQYLSFAFEGRAPLALGIDWPEQDLAVEATLSADQRSALQADLDD